MCSRRSAYASIGALVSAFHQSVAFSPNTIRPLHKLDGTTRLQSHAIDSEDEAMMTMMRATTCAHSEACSIEEAEKYLDEILNLQSSCISGTLSSQQLCEDVLFTSEVISDLRQKIKDGKSMQKNSLHLSPFVLTLAAIYATAGMLNVVQPGIEPFTMQEWIWSIRDGYFSQMLSEFIQYGGLRVEEVSVVPFTPQEIWWSIKDGYVFDLLSEKMKYGGMLTLDSVEVKDVPSLPFEAKEWVVAIRDGYVDDMVSHYYRNGGL